LDGIFDGIQRPLDVIKKVSGDIYIPKGVRVEALDKKKLWPFEPANLKVCSSFSDASHNNATYLTDTITWFFMRTGWSAGYWW
jgi:vacuolar-type H+-ATPase catalytic subunit A/Vma1